MAQDRSMKSGQITLPRVLFLGVVGAVIVGTVALGGIYLTIGYWLITIGFCVLLYFVMVDYGIKDQVVDPGAQQAASIETGATTASVGTTAVEARARKRAGSRPAKRRR
jgi:hypothetical protein